VTFSTHGTRVPSSSSAANSRRRARTPPDERGERSSLLHGWTRSSERTGNAP
jgi:hypothetical protein